MEHAPTTKINDAVTMRQFNRFLTNATLPPLWEGKIKSLQDVVEMPIIFQDKLFASWISQYLKKDDKFPEGKPYPNSFKSFVIVYIL